MAGIAKWFTLYHIDHTREQHKLSHYSTLDQFSFSISWYFHAIVPTACLQLQIVCCTTSRLLPFVPHCLMVASTSAAMAYRQVVKSSTICGYVTSGSIWSAERSSCWPFMAENIMETISGATVDLILPLLFSDSLMWRPFTSVSQLPWRRDV